MRLLIIVESRVNVIVARSRVVNNDGETTFKLWCMPRLFNEYNSINNSRLIIIIIIVVVVAKHINRVVIGRANCACNNFIVSSRNEIKLKQLRI